MDEKIIHIVIAKNWGGGEQYVYDICGELLRRGIKAYVVVDITNIEMQKKFSEVANIVPASLHYLAGILSIKKLVSFIKKHNIKYINCHSGHAMMLCLLLKKFTGAKVFMYKHNAIAAKHDVYHKWQRKYTDAFICVSKLVYELQTKSLNNDEKHKFHLIYNGINTNNFNKYENLLKNNDTYTVGYAGRITENKGINILIEAFALLSEKYDNVRLILAGAEENNYLGKLEGLIYSNGIEKKVKYLGKLNDMERFYRHLNVFVLPSVVREAFGLVLCEAIYCGIPVITTDSGAQKEIIKDKKFGVIVPLGNVRELYNALESFYICGSNFDKNGKIYVEQNFSIRKCVDNILSLYANT